MSLLDTFFGRQMRPGRKAREIVYEQAKKTPRMTTTVTDTGELSNQKEAEPIENRMCQQEEATEEHKEVSMKTEMEKLTKEIENLSGQMESLQKAVEENRSVIAEKVHMENVKAFRNVQAILEELDEKMAKSDRQEKQMDSLKTYIKCATWFSIMNLFVLVLFVLYTMGVF